ncbi:nicotinate (nicotinamide) nucleotide adenylyltransferase [Thermodesulfobacterium sp. TA1]|uniref:nicotinate-nucleotide adenylyltransferase n=1 Tax=Thermodesulfobacterium sp. TA1 TaxID=2234087 RepID=UPI00123247E0|nr:nicotinate-nucleotide adenylyltransferase [Thermodesulfobacterium sp. TA1]QER41241.1 nicotinate (nicotinamide) nucleotide adenylyltransferase [Thermodesulfobacterium sp. TA1]
MDRLELKRVGILGGTFDPPHLAHLRVAEEVREALSLQEVWFIPAGYPPHKKSELLSPFEDRLEMVKLAIRENPFFKALDIEKEAKPSYTLNTLKSLRACYPEIDFFLIVGWDSFRQFETWWNYQLFLDYAKLVVVSRNSKTWGELKEEFLLKVKDLWRDIPCEGKVYFLEVTPLDISSSKVRHLVKSGRSIRYLVPEGVLTYILEHRLYR